MTEKKQIIPQKEILLELYKKMFLIRTFEEKIIEVYPEKEIKTPVHLYIGQEAIASGISQNLTKHDLVLSNHRSHGHYLAKGGNINSAMAEIYGKKTGCSKGMGGSMHLIDKDVGFLGSSGIVGGAIPIAVGAAYTQKYNSNKNICIVYFGDGACDEGILYESMNLALLKKLAIIFVFENNMYATCSKIDSRHANINMIEKAKAFGIKTEKVDGNDAIEIYETIKKHEKIMRKDPYPLFIECNTYRWMGHVGITDDLELEYRTKEELNDWKIRCPIKKLKEYLLNHKITEKKEISLIEQSIINLIQNSVENAKKASFPDKDYEKNLFA